MSSTRPSPNRDDMRGPGRRIAFQLPFAGIARIGRPYMSLSQTLRRYSLSLRLLADVTSCKSIGTTLLLAVCLDIVGSITGAMVPLMVAAAFARLGAGTATGFEDSARDGLAWLFETASIRNLCVASLACVCIAATASAAAAGLVVTFTIDARLRLRDATYTKAVSIPLDGGPLPSAGEAVSMIRIDAGTVADFLQSTLHPLISALIRMIAMVSAILFYDAHILPYLFAFVPLAIGSQWVWERRVAPLFNELQRLRLQADKSASAVLGGLRIARALGRTSSVRSEWILNEKRMADTEAMAARRNRWIFASWEIAIPAATIFVLWTAGDKGVRGADVLLLTVSLGMVLGPMQNFFQLLRTGGASLAAAERVTSFLAQPSTNPDQCGVTTVDREGEASLEAADVSFCYAQRQHQALSGVSFSLSAGQSLAVVGPSGSGKSTLGAILCGIFSPSGGTVTLAAPFHGRNARRPIAAIVDQDAYLFEGTVRANILFGSPHTPPSEVERVARLAALDDLLEGEDGLGFSVGAGGHGLSGGQRCRVALARALLMDPEILVIDEFSSQLDRELELEILRRLKEERQSRFCIYITHSADVAQNCDKIAVFRAGHLADFGTWREVRDRDPFVRSMLNTDCENT